MRQIKKLLWLAFILLPIVVPATSLHATLRSDVPGSDVPDPKETVLVGRISHVEGQLLRYLREENEWVATVKDAPFYIDDLLYSDEKGRAEFVMPNNTWIRIDGDTKIQLNDLTDQVTEIDMAFGLVRFYNRGSHAVIKATTPFGYVVAPEETSFDLYVGDDSIEVIALKGRLDFVHHTSEARFEVIQGTPAIIADNRQVTAGKGEVDPDWDRWNRQMEDLWATRNRLSEESAKYLPPRLGYEAYALEEHGTWESVYYDGTYRYFWRPLYVSAGWAPFTVGRWTVCYGEHVWIPCEPFGYVTHHYGNWVFVRGYWYWAPPVARMRVRVGFPLLEIGFAWYPGRVAWIYSGSYIGWVPLAPHEPYYCYRRWGPRSIVVKNVDISDVNIERYEYCRHAVIVQRGNFYTVKDYRKARVRDINHGTLVKNYRLAPVLSNTAMKSYEKTKARHDFTDVWVEGKLPSSVSKTIQQRRPASEQDEVKRDQSRRQNVSDVKQGRPEQRAYVRSPRNKDRSNLTDQVERLVEEESRDGALKQRALPKIEDGTVKVHEKQDVRASALVKSVMRGQKAGAEDRGYAGKAVQKAQVKSLPKSGKYQEARTNDQGTERQYSRARQENNNRAEAGRENSTTRRTLQSNDQASQETNGRRGRIGFAGDTSYRKQTNNEGRLFH